MFFREVNRKKKGKVCESPLHIASWANNRVPVGTQVQERDRTSDSGALCCMTREAQGLCGQEVE